MDTLFLIACGLLSGFLAGLLGIGGGFVVVPAMLVWLPSQTGDTPWLAQMAVATSLAAMVPTTLSALFAQCRRGAVDAPWLRSLSPGVALGALLGAALLPVLPASWVAAVFAVYAGYFSWRQFQPRAGAPSRTASGEAWRVSLAATLIGGVSVLAGVGGAVFTVPYLQSHELPIHRAVATSSGVALLLSVCALLRLSLGASEAVALVWWPAAVWIGASAMLAAPLGVRTAHRLPVRRLKQVFALLLLCACALALHKVWSL
jgi:uncharacterized protein